MHDIYLETVPAHLTAVSAHMGWRVGHQLQA